MTAFNKTDRRSAEAGLKYFLFGSTATAFVLFGLSLVYGMCGTTVLDAIGQKVATQAVTPLLGVGVVMILAGLAFKIAAAPFHFWAPDAYEGSPAPTGALIASGSKVAAFLAARKNSFGRIWFSPGERSLAWIRRGLVSITRIGCRALYRRREHHRAGAKKSASIARLLRGGARRLHPSRSNRAGIPGLRCNLILYDYLRVHARWCIWGGWTGPAADWGGCHFRFCRPPFPFPATRSLYGDFPCFLGRATTVGWFFR